LFEGHLFDCSMVWRFECSMVLLLNCSIVRWQWFEPSNPFQTLKHYSNCWIYIHWLNPRSGSL